MPGQVIRRGKSTWLLRVFLGIDPDTGKRHYANKTVHADKKTAEAELTRMLRDRDTGKLTAGALKLTIGALLDDLLLDYKVNRKSLDWATIIVEKHLRPAFGGLSVSGITTQKIRRYIASRQERGAANGTINRELSLLRRSLNLAAKSDPPKVGRVPFIPSLEECNVRKGFFEDPEYRMVLRALPDHLKPLIAAAYFTACRRGELLLLQWSQVDLLEGVMRLEPGETKNREARTVPLAPELRELLAMQKAAQDPACPWVFSYRGHRLHDFRAGWHAACQKAGLWQGDNETGRPTKLFHDLRRTGIRNLVRAGAPEAVAMRISGHKTRAVFDRYNIVSGADLKDAARRLGEYLERKRAESAIPHTLRTQEQNRRAN